MGGWVGPSATMTTLSWAGPVVTKKTLSWAGLLATKKTEEDWAGSPQEEKVCGWGQGWEVALPNPSQSDTLRHPITLILPQAQIYKPPRTPVAAGSGSVAGLGSGTGSMVGICCSVSE